MDDYELERARAWDDTLANEAPASPSEDGWQTVDHSKKKPTTVAQRDVKPQQSTQPAPRATQPAPRNSQPPTRAVRPAAEQKRQQPPQAVRPALPDALQPRRERWPQRAAGRTETRRPMRSDRQFRMRQPGPSEAVRSPRPPPALIDEVDNEATLAWRAKLPATNTVRIPTDIVLADKLRNSPPTYERLAQESSAFIYCSNYSPGMAIMTFDLWGDHHATRQAKLSILHWIDINENPEKNNSAPEKFPTVVSLTDKLRERANKRWERDLKRNGYRRDPPIGMALGAVGTFHWPTDEFRPDEAFGAAMEALDPIRMEHRCHITFDRSKGQFTVCGKSQQEVQNALVRIRKACFTLCARQISPATAYLLHPRSSAEIPSHVYLEDFGEKSSPRGMGMIDNVQQLENARKRSELNVLRIRETIANALHNVHYLRASIKLRVHLGIFVLDSFRKLDEGDMYELQEYEDMTQATQFRGSTTEEIGGRYIESRILQLVQGWNEVLSPASATTLHLRDVDPVYRAEFLFEDSKGDFRLVMKWSEVESEPSQEWTRLHRDGGTTKLLDASLLDLRNGSSWAFEMTSVWAEQPNRLPIQYRQFAERVKIKPDVTFKNLTRKPSVGWSHFQVKPKSLRQVLSYQYNVNESDYTLELAQYQDTFFGEREVARDPRWTLNVFRIDWDVTLLQNESLAIGTKAEWKDEIGKWFPQDLESTQDGWTTFVAKLEKIEKLVRDAEAEEDADMIQGANDGEEAASLRD